jgi:glutamate-5-semialdehyde dehydrogenase
VNFEIILPEVKKAAQALRSSSNESRNRVLHSLAKNLQIQTSTILAANQLDLSALPSDALSSFRDRLTLNEKRIGAMVEGLIQVAALPDPLNEVVEERVLLNGLRTRRVRSPLGVIFMIFESRPNVAIEAFSLAFKSGNAILLRGGKESIHTVAVLYRLIHEALIQEGFSTACLEGITDPDRAMVLELLQAKKWIDVVVPRGGDRLIEFVVENSKIPIIKNDRGMCHVYVHEDADLKQALTIIENAKMQRPGVCNAMETLLVHAKVAERILPELYALLSTHEPKLEWFGCVNTLSILAGKPLMNAAVPESFDTEYLDYRMNCKVVSNVDEAIQHIETHGSKHSEAILTSNEAIARRFQSEIDAAAVYWNASTRFTDGLELGLGGELGISTQKLHVRGPVGLKELTSIRWIMDGTGQIRE